MMDVNGMWNYEQALHALRRLEPANLELIEQPLPYWDLEGMARLRQKVSTPIFADESARDGGRRRLRQLPRAGGRLFSRRSPRHSPEAGEEATGHGPEEGDRAGRRDADYSNERPVRSGGRPGCHVRAD